MSFTTFMSGWGWVIFSLISTVFSAGVYLLNQYLRQPGHLLVFWSRVATILLLAPWMMHIELPTDPRFHIAVLLTALFGAFADIRTYNVASRYGGGVVSRVQPLIIILSFIIWFFFDPALRIKYAAHPVNTGLILLALVGCIYFSVRLRKCHINRAAFLQMLPALLCYTTTILLNKYAMNHGPLADAVYGYMYVQSAAAVVLTGGYALWRESKTPQTPINWRTKKMAVAAVVLAAGWICSMILKLYAMAFIPNPAYQAAIGQTAPVFIALFYWLVKHKEEGDVASGMGIMACTILLALLTV